QFGIDPLPIDFLRQADQLVLHVDDLVEPGAKQVVRAALLRPLRSHRTPPDAAIESQNQAFGIPQNNLRNHKIYRTEMRLSCKIQYLPNPLNHPQSTA